MQIPLILVGDHVKAPDGPAPQTRPRLDYEEITRLLAGELCCTQSSFVRLYTLGQRIDQYLRLDLMAAMLAARRIARYSAILSLSEKSAIPLAALSYARRLPVPHIVVAHKLSSGHKVHLFRSWPLHRRFNHLISVCSSQAEYAIANLGLPRRRVNFFYDKVDQLFFQPQADSSEEYILAVGLEQRDYGTLLQALQGTHLQTIILANSRWNAHSVQLQAPPHVKILTSRLSYTDVRSLYAGARLVVVPLYPVDYAAGVNSVLETMAMAKPLVVSQVVGIRDYIVDGETGWFAKPGSPQHLREQIMRLWSDDAARRRVGANARQAVLQQMNLDLYAANVANVVTQAVAQSGHGFSPANDAPI